MKYLFLILTILFMSCSTRQAGYICVDCISAALRVQLIDSQDSSIVKGATIIAINNTKHDTIIFDSSYIRKTGSFNSDSQYVFWGVPGNYSLTINHPQYYPVTISDVSVTQWSEVTCEHANTENLIIGLVKKSLPKIKNRNSSGIISQFTKGHCG